MMPAAAPGSLVAILAVAALVAALRAGNRAGAALALPSLAIGLLWLPITQDSPTNPPEGTTLRMIVWNTHGWDSDRDDRLEFLRVMRGQSPDLIVLQEAWLEPPAVLEDLKTVWPAWTIRNESEWTILSRYPLTPLQSPAVGGLVSTRLTIGSQEITLLNVHIETAVGGPRRFERRREQFRHLREPARNSPLTIIAGDFNTPWHHPWMRELRRDWTVSNPAGLAVPLTVPSILPIARYDYVFAAGGIIFGGYRRLLHARQVLGHAGLVTVAHLPPS